MTGKSSGNTCPVCGHPGSPQNKWVLNKVKKRYEPYRYFAHRVKENGKWKVKWCYIGRSDDSHVT